MKRFGIWALLALACLATAQKDDTIVTINGKEIKADEYYKEMEFLPGVGKRIENTIIEFPPGLLALDKIITDRLTLQLAEEKGIKISDAEIQDERTRLIGEDPQVLKVWLEGGRTEEQFLYSLRVGIAKFKIQTFGITVTDQEVKQHYDTYPSRFTSPKRYALRVIVVETEEQKKSVEADLKSGKTFGDVAEARSEDVSKLNKGSMGVLPVTSLGEDLKAALGKLKEGERTEWLPAFGLEAMFLVEKILPEAKLPLDDKLKRDLRRSLMLDRGRVKNDVNAEMRKIRTKANIKITNPEFAAAYEAYIKRYLEPAQP